MLHSIIAATSSSDSSNPFQVVIDFFKSPTWHFITLLFYFLVAVLWIACAYWVFKDARRRIDDKIVIAVCVLAGIVFGPLGLIVYAIVRPPELLADRDERELEMQMMTQRLGEDTRCSFCKTPVKDEFLVCPTCGRRLRSQCTHCGKPLDPNWRVCPYCETDARSAPAGLYDRL